MVRLCDKEVYTANLSDLTRGKLFTHFCKKGHNTDIIMVYGTGGKLEGYISYDMLLKNAGEGVEACLETYRLFLSKEKKNLFEEAREFFDSNPEKTWLLVCNENGEPECFSYYDNRRPYYREYDDIFKTYEIYWEELMIQKVFPQIQQVHIYGCNEWAYQLLNILRNQKIPVKTIGDKWKYLKQNVQIEEVCPDYGVLNIYAEGTQTIIQDTKSINYYSFNDVTPSFDFLKRVLIAYCHKKMDEFQSNYGNAKIFICQFPSSEKITNSPQEVAQKMHKMEQKELMIKQKFQKDLQPDKERLNEITESKFGHGKDTIYLVGPCIVAGFNVSWDDTLMNYLQKLLEKRINNFRKESYSVTAIACGEYNYIKLNKILDTISLTSKDILLFIKQEHYRLPSRYWENADLELTELYNNRPKSEFWFWDAPIHTTKYGNKAVAEEIFKKLIEPAIEKMAGEEEIILKESVLSEEENDKLKTYLSKIKSYTEDIPVNAKIGSIVMNCNPFTLGHRYLIEEAAAQVDYLFVFVVEEDKSVFPFEKRMEMVKRGTGDLKNVRVYPSGEYILSNKTMPAYFEKEILQEVHVDASRDIGIFSNYVAPELHISVRFAGTEPLDQVTEQYNREMERTLKKHGIDFVEIPRKEQNGKPISASLVRALLEQKDWKELEKLVPKSSFFGLKEMYPDLSNEG